MRIPITMCHGLHTPPAGGQKPLTPDHFRSLFQIARDLGFETITYDRLETWREGTDALPARPIMIDFDHPALSIQREAVALLHDLGYVANLFVDTGRVVSADEAQRQPDTEREYMTWDEIREVRDAGWLIGAHTVTHPNLSELCAEDPDGTRIAEELDKCNEEIERYLGAAPKDFAFTGTSWSSSAERAVMERYRFGRLWIIGSEYHADGRKIRYAELAGVDGEDEPDGGPPAAARYITHDTPPYRLPSMELQALVYTQDAFRAYLEGACQG